MDSGRLSAVVGIGSTHGHPGRAHHSSLLSRCEGGRHQEPAEADQRQIRGRPEADQRPLIKRRMADAKGVRHTRSCSTQRTPRIATMVLPSSNTGNTQTRTWPTCVAAAGPGRRNRRQAGRSAAAEGRTAHAPQEVDHSAHSARKGLRVGAGRVVQRVCVSGVEWGWAGSEQAGTRTTARPPDISTRPAALRSHRPSTTASRHKQ